MGESHETFNKIICISLDFQGYSKQVKWGEFNTVLSNKTKQYNIGLCDDLISLLFRFVLHSICKILERVLDIDKFCLKSVSKQYIEQIFLEYGINYEWSPVSRKQCIYILIDATQQGHIRPRAPFQYEDRPSMYG